MVAAPTFAVNTAPVGCHQSPNAGAAIAVRLDPGTVQAVDRIIREPDGTWQREVERQCWIRTDPAPVRTFSTLAMADAFAATLRPAPAVPVVPAVRPAAAAPGAPASAPGGLSVSATLSTATCRGGAVTLSVAVTDAQGAPIAGAAVSGHVAYRTAAHDFVFPPTNGGGRTSTVINTGRPRGGYTVIFSVRAQASAASGTASATCFAQ